MYGRSTPCVRHARRIRNIFLPRGFTLAIRYYRERHEIMKITPHLCRIIPNDVPNRPILANRDESPMVIFDDPESWK